MKKVPSFTIDHTRLLRGVYVSRRDRVGDGVVTTFDIRMKEPNRESPLSGPAIHSIEHLAATFLRNDPQWSDSIIYWGPMGCLTGNYLLMKGELEPRDILDLLRRTFTFIASFDGDIPGSTPADCGNWTYNDLPAARAEARKFLEEVLLDIKAENINYPSI